MAVLTGTIGCKYWIGHIETIQYSQYIPVAVYSVNFAFTKLLGSAIRILFFHSSPTRAIFYVTLANTTSILHVSIQVHLDLGLHVSSIHFQNSQQLL